MDLGVLTEEDVDRLEMEVKDEIQEAFEEADKLPSMFGASSNLRSLLESLAIDEL